MLLGRVLGELSQAAKVNCLNVDSETDESVSSDSEANGYNSCAKSSPELDLHLESERDFFNRLLTRRKELTGQTKSDADLVCPCSVSVPFKWEEKPGKPKHQDPQMNTVALRLPPVQKSNSVGRDTNLVSNCPRTLSERLRNILQPKLHTIKLYETEEEAKGEVDPSKIALNVLHYPEEFAWRSLRNSSPISIFEGPDSSPSSCSSLSLLSYCSSNNRPLTSSSARHMQNSVPALLANRLIPVTEMLNAVPVDVDPSDSQFLKFVPLKVGDVGLPELCRVKSVKADFSSHAKKLNSQRSVSWGGAEFISRGQPKSVPSPDLRLKHCHTNVDVDNSSVSKCVSNGVASDPNPSQGIPNRSKQFDKVNKDFNASHEEDCRQSQLIESYEKKFKDVKLQQKRWHFSMRQRMSKVSCCSTNASTTINCCSSRRPTHTTNCKGRRKNNVSLPKHQRLQVELRKLQEKDEIQK